MIPLFLFGLAIGSFLNVLIDRLPRNEPITGRSHCEFCKRALTKSDLVPILSFIILKGKCRYCKKPISPYYPIVELTTGILFVLTIMFTQSNNLISSIYYLTLMSSLIVIFFTDLKYGIIPNKIVYPGIIFSFAFLISLYPNILISNLFAAIGSFLFFLFLSLITRGRGMGMGDVKFAFLMGLFLGFPKIIIALYVAFLTGALVSLILVLWGKKKFKGTIVFGPFLVFGTFASFFFGEKILQIILQVLQLWSFW